MSMEANPGMRNRILTAQILLSRARRSRRSFLCSLRASTRSLRVKLRTICPGREERMEDVRDLRVWRTGTGRLLLVRWECMGRSGSDELLMLCGVG